MNKMPTKIKILLTSLIAVSALIILSFFVSGKNLTGLGANIFQTLGSNNKAGQNETGSQNNFLATKNDTDKDGLFDSEEPLYKTDPLNPDTDGDGFLDGEEVASECSPIVSGCKDKIQTSENSRSLTEELSDLITGGIIAGDLKPDNPNFAESVTALKNYSFINNQTLLSVDDSEISFNPAKDDSKKYRQAYINDLGTIFEEYLISTSNQSKLNINLSDEGVINLYSDSLESLKGIEQKILKLTVPASWVEFHKKVLIFIKKSELFYQNIIEYEEDPVKALLTLNSITSLQNEYKSIISEALKEIDEQNLTLQSRTILQLLSN